MRTFVYKRTHKGDPDDKGQFGIEDCMGSRRNSDFERSSGLGVSAAMRERRASLDE